MRITALCAAMAAALIALPAAADDAAPATFRVGGVVFSVPRPPGYCLPQGKQIDVAQLVAAADTNSTTDLGLFPCNGEVIAGAGDYTLIKTPNTMLIATVTRQQLFDTLGAAFDNPKFAELMNKTVEKNVADDLNKVIPLAAKVGNALKPLGRDETCAYIGGTITFDATNMHYVQALGGCITVVGGRALMISRYGKKTGASDILQLLRESKALALSITATPG